jgi:hypothetical protein
MSDQAVSLLGRVRNPDHTGENRCVPCTIVNVLIAVGLSGAVGVVFPFAGAAVFLLSLASIYFRGYLVPGTPTFTKRYLPDRVLALFDKRPTATDESDDHTWETVEKLERERRNAVDPEQFLRQAGVAEPADDGDLYPTDEFVDSVDDHAERYRDESPGRTALADLLHTDPEEVTFEDRSYPAVSVGRRIRKWPSEAALLADVATHEALKDETEGWADVPVEQRLDVLKSFRSTRERCPACGGDVEFSEDTVESCCLAYQVVALGCSECGAPLLEYDPSEVTGGTPDRGLQP